MIARRRIVIALGAGAFAPLAGFAQQPPTKIARIGFLGTASASGFARQVEALQKGLRDLGYLEGKNIVIEFRWADGKLERLPELAAELVRLKVDVLVTHGTPGTRAAKRATATIPSVMVNLSDVVALGLVASLARPGGNVTGLSSFGLELLMKELELLKETLPRIRQVALLRNPDNPGSELSLKAMEVAARSLKVGVLKFEARGPKEFEGAFSAMAKQRVDAVAMTNDAIFQANLKAIADLAAKQRLPSIGTSDLAEAGGLFGYGANLVDMFYRSAYFVDRILKGTKPGDLPVEQPTKFEIVINMKTAKALGIKIPNSILVQATKVIE